MSSKKKNLAKQFQQNKVNRVVKSEKRYNKEKRSKSDEAYIKGDYKSSVSLRSYGVKKALANGEKVSGYGDDYIDTKGMKRSNYIKKQNGENPYEAKYLYVGGKPNTITSKDGSKFQTRTRYLTDEEKESYENTGELYHKNYRKAKSYFDTERHEGGKFEDRLKTFDGNKIKWDGLEIAKYNQKDGKHLKNLGHYAIGLGKDLIADPIVDFLKGTDRIESAITNGAYALIENYGNTLGGQDWDLGLVKDVVKHSLKESDETGWGTSSADNWRNIAKRDGTELSKGEDLALGLIGGAVDIINPIDIGGKASAVMKLGLKGAKNALRGIEGATDIMSHAPGFVPKSLTDFRGKGIVKASGKSSGASDDVFFGLKTNKSLDNTEVDRRLNNAYDVAMSKREPIKTGKPKVDNFIEMLESKPKINEQRRIDGRKLNKTKTQTKDGYVPNVIENVSDDVIEQVSDSNQISFFDEVRSKLRRKGSSEEGAMFSYNAKPFNDAFLDRGKAVDEIGEYLDIADETENFNFLKAMSEAKKVQNTMNVNSKENRLTLDLLEAFYKRKADMDKGLIPYDKEFLTNFKKLTNGKMDDINAIKAEEHALREKNLVDDFINIITKKDTKVSGSKEARKNFAIGISDISKNIANESFNNEELLKSLSEIANNNINPKTTQKALNNLLFDGKEVLVKASKKDYQEFSETISELVNFQKALKHLNATGEALEIPLSNSTKRMLGISNSTKVTVNNLKKGNKVINNPEEIYNLISNTLIDKSRSLTDRRYWEKQQMLAKEFKYKKFNDVRQEFKEIEYKYNTLKNSKRTNQTEKQFQEVSKRYNELKNLIEQRTNLYDVIKDMDANQFDKFISENYPKHMKDMKVYSTQQDKINSYVKHRDTKYKEVFDEVIDRERHNINARSAEYFGVDDVEYEDMKILYDSYKDGSLRPSQMTNKEKSIVQYMSAQEEARNIDKLNGVKNDRSLSLNKEKGYFEKLKERRKTYNLGYVNWKATPNIPKESMNYKILSTHKDTKNAINNIKATMFNAYKLKFSGGSVDEIDLLVELKRENINALRKMGIPDEAYFNEMKDISLQMLEYAKNNFKAPEKYKSKNMGDIHNKKLAEQQEKVKKTKLSNDVNKRWGIFDKRDGKFNAHQEFDIPDTYKLIDINENNDKALIKLANKNAIEEEYQRILNSSNIDELLVGHNTPSYKELVPQSGDNISKINKPNKETPLESFKPRRRGNSPSGGFFANNPFNSFSDDIYENTQKTTDDISIDEFLNNRPNEEVVNSVQKTNENNINNYKTTYLPKISEIMNLGYTREDAVKIYEDIRDGKIEAPNITHDVVQNGEHKNVKRNISDLERVLGGKYGEKVDMDSINVDHSNIELTDRDIAYRERINRRNEARRNGTAKINKYEVPSNVDPNTGEIIDNVVNKSDMPEVESVLERTSNKFKYNKLSDTELKGYVRNGTKKQRKNAIKELRKRGIDTKDIEVKSEGKTVRELQNNKQPKVTNGASRKESNAFDNLTRSERTANDYVKYNVDPETGEIIEEGKKFNPMGIEPNPNALDKVDDKIDVIDLRESKRPKPLEKIDPRTVGDFDGAKYNPRTEEDLVKRNINPFTGEVLQDGEKINPMTGETIKKKKTPLDNVKTDDIQESIPQKQIEEYKTEVEELKKQGVDATKQPPKERPQNMQPSLYKKWLNAWKKGVTIYNPGWHVQNFFQNKAQNYFALGNKAFMPQTDAKNILKTIKGKDAKSVNINSLDNKELARLAEELGVVDSFGDDIQLAQNGIFGKIENSKPMQKLQEVEKNARLHHFLEQMKNGMTPEQAARSVNKYLYDYSKENKFDRAMKHVDPFWTFHKNNARMLTTSAIEHPSRMNNIMRANRGLEGDIPEEYKQDEEAMYREYQDPTKTYTDHKGRQYNYLYNQDMFSDISDAIPLSKDSLVGKLNPLIQIALRTAKGEGKFGNKIVDSNKSIEDGWNELLYEDAGYNKVSSNVAIKDALLDVNPILPGLVETIDAINADKHKANNGGMPQEIADKRALNEWIKLITGHKGNWYRNTK